VVPRDVGGRPDRIEALQIGLRHEAKDLLALLGLDRRCTERTDGGCSRASDDLSPTDAKSRHLFTHEDRAGQLGTRQQQAHAPRPVTTLVSAEKCDELPPPHSITSSARSTRPAGTS